MEQSSFFNAIINNGIPDRVYKAEGFARFFSSFIGNGVFPNPSTNLNVTGLNNNMTITVKKGKAWINGYFYENTDDLILNISNADGVLNRIDRAVIRLDFLNREIKIYVKKGSFATNPIAPAIQRDADIYELAIADIKINAGSINITQSNITDLRLNKEVCGIVTQTVETIDTTTLYNQLQSYIEEKSIDMKTWIENAKEYFSSWLSNTQTEYNNEFEIWFNEIKGTLDADVASNLFLKINELEEYVNNLELVANKIHMNDGSTVEDNINYLKSELGINKSTLESNINAIREVL